MRKVSRRLIPMQIQHLWPHNLQPTGNTLPLLRHPFPHLDRLVLFFSIPLPLFPFRSIPRPIRHPRYQPLRHIPTRDPMSNPAPQSLRSLQPLAVKFAFDLVPMSYGPVEGRGGYEGAVKEGVPA